MKKHYQLITSTNKNILFEGQFHSFVTCLQEAVKQKINLHNIDLSNRNLSNANLDDAVMPEANFTNANLTGTNLSESHLKGSLFKNTLLYNTCLCFSNLTECNFEDALFGGTDINGAILTKSRFSTLSCFSLNFYSAQNMYDCVFSSPDTPPSKMSHPPIVINGLKSKPIILTDNCLQYGHNLLSHTKWSALLSSISSKKILQAIEKQ